MVVLTPASCETARSKAYERGLRDAVRIFAGFELSPEQLSAIVVDAGFEPLSLEPRPRPYPHPSPGHARRQPKALSRRTASTVRRGLACEAEADRIAEIRSDRTGSPHEVVKLPGGRYGVRKVQGARSSGPGVHEHGRLTGQVTYRSKADR